MARDGAAASSRIGVAGPRFCIRPVPRPKWRLTPPTERDVWDVMGRAHSCLITVIQATPHATFRFRPETDLAVRSRCRHRCTRCHAAQWGRWTDRRPRRLHAPGAPRRSAARACELAAAQARCGPPSAPRCSVLKTWPPICAPNASRTPWSWIMRDGASYSNAGPRPSSRSTPPTPQRHRGRRARGPLCAPPRLSVEGAGAVRARATAQCRADAERRRGAPRDRDRRRIRSGTRTWRRPSAHRRLVGGSADLRQRAASH